MLSQYHLLTSPTLLSGGSLIDVDGTIFIQAALFFLAMLVLNWTVFRPMIALFEAREQAIDGSKEEAERLRADSEEKAAAFEQKLVDVRAKAAAERQQLLQESLAMQQTLLAKVRSETQALVDDTRKELDRQSAVTRSVLHASVPNLAKQVVSTLLGREIA
ncbi:MAG: ATP synthase F0 subunit B [Myxococcota bacterium]